ncbi:MAG TPA: lipid-A-disaccharide synthase [Gammaproteobacteria bacterium]|nr:lipid-A-disaccharide synthase [Gammaproteobacteria bacterium]
MTSGFSIALAAGEQSGDALGAGLIEALKSLAPGTRFVGIAGPKMIAAGCEPWFRAEELSVMGLAEVLPHLPRLLRIRRELRERIKALPADVFVGIDAPDFNLPAARWLKRAGIPAVQYVSPQVWAWRQGRVKTIRGSVDLVLCVLPFETKFYAEHGVAAKFIGHPLADAIPLTVDRAAARAALGLPAGKPLLAVLPGSRRAEVGTLAAPFTESAAWVQRERPEVEVAVALASEPIGELYRAIVRGIATPRPAHLITARAREVLAAADVVLTASGTASLEALLIKRPMVVAHRIVPLTYWIVRRLGVAKLPHFSLPNLLAGRELVPEFVQRQVRADVLGPVLRDLLDGKMPVPDWYDAFTSIHKQLRCDASVTAAREVLDLVRARHP